MRQRHPRTDDPNPAPTLAYCETVTATATSPQHVRRVGPEGLKPGGGAPDTVLCGRPLRGGWDLPTAVTADTVRQLGTPRPGDGRVVLCTGCRDAALTLLAGPAAGDAPR